MEELWPNEIEFLDLLPFYYRRLFPYHLIHQWLGYGNNNKSHYFKNREFSFTVKDVYMRFQTFQNSTDMEGAVQYKCPDKIDIGAVYISKPSDPRKIKEPIERELTFDIDLCDYDEIRTCCQKGRICGKCWKLMAIACKVLHRALLEDYGFQHQLWVFSGRRGIHCWVCDANARRLDTDTREAIADYLQVLTSAMSHKKVRFENEKLHTSIRSAKEIIAKQFMSACVEDQDILGTPERIATIFALFPKEARMSELKERMKILATSRDRWEAIVKHIVNLGEQGELKTPYKYLLEEVMLQYAYPRLDLSVTIGMAHLLKAPFCIHHITGKLCAPFDPLVVDSLNPDRVPTLTQLYNQINKMDRDRRNNGLSVTKAVDDYMYTSMSASIRVFKAFLDKMQAIKV